MAKNTLPKVTLIYDRYKKASPTRRASVEIRITHNYKQKYISTGIMLYPNQWSKGMIVNTPDIIQISHTLDTLLKKVRQVILDMLEEGSIDIFSITNRIKVTEVKNLTFLEYCKQRVIIKKFGKSKGTQKRYDIFMEHFERWGGIIDFPDITDTNIIAYDNYMANMKPSSKWGNYHKYLNLFILDAINAGLLTRNPYKWIIMDKGKDSHGLERCLTLDEFSRLRHSLMPTASLERIKDIFIFQTYTCMSYSDLCIFNPKNIRDINGTKVYTGSRIKTSKPFTIPLLSPTLEILAKYNNQLPVISNVKYNEYLKVVAQAAKIDKPISSHWARHTGATLLLNEGIDMKIVSKICGHSSMKITEQIYAKLFDETVVDAVQKVMIQKLPANP